MRLAALADRLWFELVDGAHVYAASPSDVLLYDADGVYWPKCSMLVAPVRFGRRRVAIDERDAKARRAFGATAAVGELAIRRPPRALEAWRPLGRVRRAFFVGRVGPATGREAQHTFGRKPLLLERGRALRLELGAGCRVLEHHIFIDP